MFDIWPSKNMQFASQYTDPVGFKGQPGMPQADLLKTKCFVHLSKTNEICYVNYCLNNYPIGTTFQIAKHS